MFILLIIPPPKIYQDTLSTNLNQFSPSIPYKPSVSFLLMVMRHLWHSESTPLLICVSRDYSRKDSNDRKRGEDEKTGWASGQVVSLGISWWSLNWHLVVFTIDVFQLSKGIWRCTLKGEGETFDLLESKRRTEQSLRRLEGKGENLIVKTSRKVLTRSRLWIWLKE